MNINLLENFQPHILSPVRGNRSQHQGLQFRVPENQFSVHSNTGSNCRFTIGVTSRSEIIETRLQSKLEVRTRERLVKDI